MNSNRNKINSQGERTWWAPLLCLLIGCASLFPACDQLEEHYSTNPNLRLDFSTDTLAFDTVFTTVGSATRQFMIYNRNQEPLDI
ncbi:MAG: hypothetical protein SPJ02_03170 [Parabacteroides sp.]|nr:hypothetical protein [Parabacteroides sp.]